METYSLHGMETASPVIMVMQTRGWSVLSLQMLVKFSMTW